MSGELIARVPADHAYAEARRQLTVCNACRYCEGYCPVFPAMTHHRTFSDETLTYMANLCHQCTACYHACQYKPPHALAINLPPALNAVRHATYTEFVWPRGCAPLFMHPARLTAVCVALFTALLAAALAITAPSGTLVNAHTGPGAFYAVLPHAAMAGLAGALVLAGLICVIASATRYARGCGIRGSHLTQVRHWRRALRAVATLEHLNGGQGQGCPDQDDRHRHARRYCHQATLWGFVLCAAATATATVYELWLGQLSPFAYSSPPVVLGTLGGVALSVGCSGLLWLKRRRHPEAFSTHQDALNTTLSVQLLAIALSGLALLAARETAAMPTLLVLHLGWVYGFFVTLPFGKMMHAVYRTLALLRAAAADS